MNLHLGSPDHKGQVRGLRIHLKTTMTTRESHLPFPAFSLASFLMLLRLPRSLSGPLFPGPTFWTSFSSGSLTCFWERRAHSSRVSAASSFPWRLYRAPRFLRVVLTVGLWGGSEDGFRKETEERGSRDKIRSKGRREKVPEARIKVWMEGVGGQACFSLVAHLLTLQALYQPPYSV